MGVRPDRGTYSVLDFQQWADADTLEISPKFQRRPVWKPPAKSFLIETILLGLPIPPVYLRVTQNKTRTKTIREVVDGQQRLRTVLEFVRDEFKLGKIVAPSFRGLRYSDLDEVQQDAFRSYPFTCELLHGISDAEILQIFARVNINAIRLNKQELRNGRFFGFFKQSAYALSFQHIQFWRLNGIVTETAIARMQEVELTSELLIAMIDGMQDKKNSIDRYYAMFDDDFPQQERLEKAFRTIVDDVGLVAEQLGGSIKQTEFRRRPLFYSLFLALYHRRYGLKGIEASPNAALTAREAKSFARNVEQLSDAVAEFKKTNLVSTRLSRFVSACTSQTDNIGPRRIRLRALLGS